MTGRPRQRRIRLTPYRRVAGTRLALPRNAKPTPPLSSLCYRSEKIHDDSAERHSRVPSASCRHPNCPYQQAAGLEIAQCRNEQLRLEFFDVGAMALFLRKVIWTVPDFSADRYRDRLKDLHDQIERDGPFHPTMSRILFEARKPPAR